MEYKSLKVERDGEFMLVTLNRSEKLNALNLSPRGATLRGLDRGGVHLGEVCFCTGPVPQYGEYCQQGLEMALEDVAKEGWIIEKLRRAYIS